MPDLLSVISRRWGLILLLTLAGTCAALVASLLSPKLYLGATTALPVNTLVNDKARIFNTNIEALYSEIGTADELDKLEGTAQLDTVYMAVASRYRLSAHYRHNTAAGDALEKAALFLKRASDISRTGYGELKIKVWDKDPQMAAALANGLLQVMNAIHERLQTENNKTVLQKLKEGYTQKLQQQRGFPEAVVEVRSSSDTVRQSAQAPSMDVAIQNTVTATELNEYRRLIGEYELAVQTTPKSLLVVEQARPSPWHDRPKTSRNVLLALLASLFFAFLLAVYVESRRAA